MENTLHFPMIKGAPKPALAECLTGYKKDRLMMIAEQHQVPLKKSFTKARMITELLPTLKTDFLANTDQSRFRTLSLVNEINAHAEAAAYEEAIQKGYIYLFQKDNQLFLVFPKEFADQLQRPAVSGKSESTAFEKSRKNFEQIFGYVDMNFLNQVWNRS